MRIISASRGGPGESVPDHFLLVNTEHGFRLRLIRNFRLLPQHVCGFNEGICSYVISTKFSCERLCILIT